MKYANVGHCGYSIIKEEGVASFWRGSMCSFMKVQTVCVPRWDAWYVQN